MIATSKASDATSSASAKRAAERSRGAAVRGAPRARPQHTRFPQRRSPAPAQRSLDQQAGGTADPRGACGGRLMNAAHKFPMPTVSLDLTTSGGRAIAPTSTNCRAWISPDCRVAPSNSIKLRPAMLATTTLATTATPVELGLAAARSSVSPLTLSLVSQNCSPGASAAGLHARGSPSL